MREKEEFVLQTERLRFSRRYIQCARRHHHFHHTSQNFEQNFDTSTIVSFARATCHLAAASLRAREPLPDGLKRRRHPGGCGPRPRPLRNRCAPGNRRDAHCINFWCSPLTLPAASVRAHAAPCRISRRTPAMPLCRTSCSAQQGACHGRAHGQGQARRAPRGRDLVKADNPAQIPGYSGRERASTGEWEPGERASTHW